jgi:hypothetical protein
MLHVFFLWVGFAVVPNTGGQHQSPTPDDVRLVETTRVDGSTLRLHNSPLTNLPTQLGQDQVCPYRFLQAEGAVG